MFIKKIRIKKDIPEELRLELRALQEKKKNEKSRIQYSLSPSQSTLDKAVKEIKETKLEPSFRDVLFEYIDNKGLKDSDVYKKAKVDKRTFSKIRNDNDKFVSRRTAICLGLALELNQDDFNRLLKANHINVSDNDYFDVAIKWCIKNKIYDVEQVNDILYACNLPLLTQ